jgi:hypothetical protein
LMLEFHCDIDVIILDVGENLVESVEFHGGHAISKFSLSVDNNISTSVAPADRSFLSLICHLFKDPTALGAFATEELLARLAIVSDVLEIELFLAFLICAVLCRSSLLY